MQKKLSQAVKRFGPLLGDLYQRKAVDWAKEGAARPSSQRVFVLHWAPRAHASECGRAGSSFVDLCVLGCVLDCVLARVFACVLA